MPPRPGLLDPSASPCDVWRPETGGPPFRCFQPGFQPGIGGRDLSDFLGVKQQKCGGNAPAVTYFHKQFFCTIMDLYGNLPLEIR